VNETLEFFESMRDRGQLGVGTIIVNRIPPSPLGHDESDDPTELALRARFEGRRERAEQALHRLRSTGVPIALLPDVPAAHDQPTRLKTLARAVEVTG
jgi:hypothetical protein